MKPAGMAASRPQILGSPSALAPSDPARVARFQNTNTESPVAQNASRAARPPSCSTERPTAIAVDSSMVSCAATMRRTPVTLRIGAIDRP